MSTPAPVKRLIARRDIPEKKGIRVKPITFWRWEKSARLTPIRIGNLVFYDEAEVDSLMQPAAPESAA